MSQQRQSNRLEHETSPYLKQHAHNPVDWHPWGPEALQRATREDRPIFLSIGYSACHWCHVMEQESFEDGETAQLMNEHFVNIKVDREERPDLDQIYMNAVVSLTGHGGWPMSVFLTPDLKPFFGGTYFPPEDRHGLPSFKRLLSGLAQAWREQRDAINENADRLTEHLQGLGRIDAPADAELNDGLSERLIRSAVAMLERAFDHTYGGFGRAPKFPHSMELQLLLRAWKRFDDAEALHMARLTLDRMALGGLYDHLGGGFHRYSTDARWLAPHFEKMLYDNALLSRAYLEAFQATGEPFYREVVEETLAWVEREMTGPEGPFYSTLDADSEGQEGKFYVWSKAEVEELLGPEAAVFCDVYDVSADGNWEGGNILNRSRTYAQDAKMLHLSEEELRRRLGTARGSLLEVRSQRPWPGRDEKVLTSWNGLMIGAFAQAAQVLDGRYLGPSTRAAEFILRSMRASDGRLYRTTFAGQKPKLNAYLEDYSFLIDALVTLYEAGFELRWLDAALELTGVMVDQFWDEAEGGFFSTGKNHEPLIVRGKEAQDSSIPSGNSMAATALLRLARLTGRSDLEEKGMRTLQLLCGALAQSPAAAGQMLLALDFHLGPVEEFAVVGPSSDADTRQARRLIQGRFQPNKVVAYLDTDLPEAQQAAQGKHVPLLAGKTAVDGRLTTYVCERFTCQAPIAGLEALRARLSAALSARV